MAKKKYIQKVYIGGSEKTPTTGNVLANLNNVQRIGIQGLPGMGFSFNNKEGSIIRLGATGTLELDISNYPMTFTGIWFEKRETVPSFQGYVIFDIVYGEDGVE